jgi:pimeloyl-ACP methyl ester carboxylesterase
MTTFLLIHGACHDGWCWDAVGKSLTRAGHIAVAPDLPCDDVTAGVNEYADTAERALGDAGRDVVVVGHSLGALTAAAIASRNEIRGLVFVAGIIGVPGKSLADLAEIDTDRDAPLEDGDFESDTAGRFRFSEVCGKRALYDDCSAELAREACSHLRFQRSLWTEVAPFDAWPAVPIDSIVCSADRIVNPQWSRRIARERLQLEPIELDAGHSPMLSRPVELADILIAGLR